MSNHEPGIYQVTNPSAFNMTEELFRQDGYASEFESIVTAVDGDWVTLEGTFFYPGGGGQACDTGSIGGAKVTETRRSGDDIQHRVPGNEFAVGDKLWCSVDWDRRYDLMRGHTAEHILFNSLQRQVPELGIVKIFISPESKYVIVDRDIPLEAVRGAVAFANSVIDDNLPVTRSVMERDDPEMERVRVHLERIEGDEISVVEIGDVDIAACSGIHVMETGEVGALFVDRKVSAGKDGTAIHFRIGEDARKAANELAMTCMEVTEVLGSKPEDVVRTAANMKAELEGSRSMLKEAAARLMESQEPESVGGAMLYAMTVPTADRKIVSDAAEKRRAEGAVCVYVFAGGSAVVASGDPRVDCREVLSAAASELGGRGGGKPGFAQGGFPGVDQDRILECLRSRASALLK